VGPRQVKVYIVELKDYGDNGWHIEKVFFTWEAADRYVAEHTRGQFGYYEIEEFEVDR
jgi:hypothetical protein